MTVYYSISANTVGDEELENALRLQAMEDRRGAGGPGGAGGAGGGGAGGSGQEPGGLGMSLQPHPFLPFSHAVVGPHCERSCPFAQNLEDQDTLSA